MFFVGRLILRELHFIYKNKLCMFLIVKAFADSIAFSDFAIFEQWKTKFQILTCTYLSKRLRLLSSTKTGSYFHEFLCRTDCSACADYQPCLCNSRIPCSMARHIQIPFTRYVYQMGGLLRYFNQVAYCRRINSLLLV